MKRTTAVAVVALLASTVAGPAVRASDEPVTEYFYVHAEDGTPLRACRVAPPHEGQFPVIFQWTSYAIDEDRMGVHPGGCPPQFSAFARRAALDGYVYVAANARGSGASGGGSYDFWSPQDARDGAYLVEWLADQPWSSGRVGLMGCSNSGQHANIVAAENPPSLAAVVTACSTYDVYRDGMYPGGIRGWFIPAGNPLFLPLHESGANVTPEMLRRGDTDFLFRPYRTVRFEAELLSHRYDGEFFRMRSIYPRIDDVRAPVYWFGSWGDYVLRGATEFAMVRKPTDRVLIYPGPHGSGGQVSGEYGFEERSLKWFDYHLKRRRPDPFASEQPIIYWELDAGRPPTDLAGLSARFRGTKKWPIPGTQWQRWYFRGGRTGTSLSLNDGALSRRPPGEAEPTDAYAYPSVSPGALTEMRHGGDAINGTALFDQRVEEAGGAVTYTSPVLEEDVHVAGPVTVTLHASSTAEETDWIVRLIDVYPDGAAQLVTNGWLKSTHRALDESKTLRNSEDDVIRPYHPHDYPLFTEPLVPHEYQIELWATATVFPRGHRIRVFISSQEAPWFLQETPPGINTVHHSSARPSSVLLPVAPPGS